jgi:uncharacterized protein YciI
MQLQAYAFVLLKSGPAARSFSDEELERLQGAHLDHLAAMAELGKLVAAGPFSDQPDPTWRGFCLYDCPVEEARELAESDPSVQVGRLVVEVMTWSTPAGTVNFPQA